MKRGDERVPRLTRFRKLATLGLLAGGLLVASPVASQAAPYEPNDTVAQASGPLNGGQDYTAGIETGNDNDYYFFNVAGQRQLDIAVTELAGSCSRLYLQNPDGGQIDRVDVYTTTEHLRYTASGSSQFVLQVTGSEGCQYRFRIDPADAVTPTSPGVVVTLNALEGADDSQKVLVDGKQVGALQGTTGPTVLSLGILPSTTRLTFEAQNQTGGWSWNVTVTNQETRNLVTTFTEKQSSASSSARVGVVRRVTMSPSGGILDSCGEALAPSICDPPLPPPPPPGPSQACMNARSQRATSAARVSATRRKLSHTRRRSARRRLSRRLASQRRELSRRTSAMRSACAV